MQMHCLSDSQKEYSARRKMQVDTIRKGRRDNQNWVKENNQNIFWTCLQFSSNKKNQEKERKNNIILNNVLSLSWGIRKTVNLEEEELGGLWFQIHRATFAMLFLWASGTSHWNKSHNNEPKVRCFNILF